MSRDTGKIHIVKSGIDQRRREVMVIKTLDNQSHQRCITWGHLILLAGLICVWGPSAQATFVVQAKGLQAEARPGTLLHGQIRLLNALFDESLDVSLKIVEFIPITEHQWQPVDTNDSMDPNETPSTGEIEIRVSGKDVNIDKLTGGSKGVTVALVTVQVTPDLSDWPFFWRE